MTGGLHCLGEKGGRKVGEKRQTESSANVKLPLTSEFLVNAISAACLAFKMPSMRRAEPAAWAGGASPGDALASSSSAKLQGIVRDCGL